MTEGERLDALEQRLTTLEQAVNRLCESLNHVAWQAGQGQAAFEAQHPVPAWPWW